MKRVKEETVSETGGRLAAICTALRRAIIEQILLPGTKLPEDALGERFGVSRTIARQALGQLAAEGLVDLRHRRGAVVATPAWEEARDLWDLRMGLERLIAGRLAGRLSPQQVARLRQHVVDEEQARSQNEPRSIRLATEFHALLAEMTGSKILVRYLNEIASRCGLILALYSRPHSADCAVSEHRSIIDALEQGDASRAIDVMDHHMSAVARRAKILENPKREQGIRAVLATLEVDESMLTSAPRAS